MTHSSSPPNFPSFDWPPPCPQVAELLAELAASGAWGRYDGPYGARLVEKLRAWSGREWAWPCSSGTIAVELALRGLGVKPDDEVILAGYDFAGNFRAVEALGARPVLVDLRADHWCLDVDQVARAISPQTRCILFSHLHGELAEAAQLRALADERNVLLLEDACQAPGARVDGRLVSAWGDAAVVSFGGSKLLTAGRGGAVLTSRPEVLQRIKVFAERGNHAFPLSELQAAVLLPQFESLDASNKRRRAAAAWLRQRSLDWTCLSPLADWRLRPDAEPTFYKLPWLWQDETATREQFLAVAQRRGLPLDAGFRGFAGRSSRRCRKIGPLLHSQIASERTVLLHHPLLVADPVWLERFAIGIDESLEELRRAR
ncbi:MAG: aminotransferase class V-fold PLP-dependent enzyme [Pirellulales bacterium]